MEALSGLFSVVAQDIEISVTANKNDNIIFSDANISKTYGDMWTFNK